MRRQIRPVELVMTEAIQAAAPSVSRPPLLRSSLVALGIPVPMLIAAADSYALQACPGIRQGTVGDWQAYAVYGLFVSQTVLLGALVGSQIRKQPLWWGILLWGVVLIDLQVFTIAAGNPWSPVSTVGFAFASSQAGALICFGVLGATPGRIRFPTAAIGLALTYYFADSLSAGGAWYTVLFLQSLATAVVCFVFRWLSFRIERTDLQYGEDRSGNRMQFSIRHLFYWTTGVAIIVALGRLIGWRSLLAMGMHTGPLLDSLIFALLLTLISILAMWGALGRERFIARLCVLLVALPAIGALLGAFVVSGANQRGVRWRWNRLFPAWTMSESIETGVVWAVLAGALLAGLLLVFRTSGRRLQRQPS